MALPPSPSSSPVTADLADAGEKAEFMSYRFAVLAAIGSLCFMAFWLWRVGLPAWVAPLYLLFAFVLCLGITRIVVEGGRPLVHHPDRRFRRHGRRPRHRRIVFWSLIIAIVVTFCGAIGMTLEVAYEHGGLNTSHYFRGQTLHPWGNAAVRLETITDPN